MAVLHSSAGFVDQLAKGRAEGEFIFTPAASGVPIVLYQSEPFARIMGRLVSVSTLLTTVGLPYSPCTAGNGGRMRG